MAITGKSVKSLKKQDLINQKSPAVGFKKIAFAHKATLGDSGFNLTTMTVPTELTANGFSQPSTSDLASVSLQFYAKNLTLTSAARGLLVPFRDYTIGGNQQINFTASFGTALANEIFYGVIDPVAKTGSLIADTNFILKTGTLSAGQVDFNVGGSWKTNINPNQQIGAVSVYLDGVLQLRNSGNATANPSADGNYQEVDNGSGESTLIRFNIADNLNDRVCTVMSNAISVVRPDGSLNDSIEKIQGSLDAVISTVADLAGVATTSFNASPTTPQLKQYGDRVVDLENNRARIDQSNTWTANQQFLGKTDGVAIAAGYVGEKLESIVSGVAPGAASSMKTIAQVTLTPGVWFLQGSTTLTLGTMSGFAWYYSIISPASNSSTVLDSFVVGDRSTTNVGFLNAGQGTYVNISSSTTYYLNTRIDYTSVGTATLAGTIRGIRIA
jgi:hypothetical protein